MDDRPILDIRNLRTHFFTYNGVVRAVDDVSLTVGREVVGIVGETGCGKSVMVRSVLRLIDEPGRIVSGEILLNGEDILLMKENALQQVRGGRIAMIFQNPLSSLNPVFTIGQQVTHVIRLHSDARGQAAEAIAVETFRQVRLPNPNRLLGKYPHELSGGQLQRAMIAMALCCRPELLIADEPTTALDVTIQAQILTLMLNLQRETGTAILFITHDLGVVAEICDRVAVMYAGKIVESAPVGPIFRNPRHPYTEGLMAAIPGRMKRGDDPETIPGVVSDLIHPPDGCRFHPRCPLAGEICRVDEPPLTGRDDHRLLACHMR